MKYKYVCELCGVSRYQDFEPALEKNLKCHLECLENAQERVKEDRWKLNSLNQNWRHKLVQLDTIEAQSESMPDWKDGLTASTAVMKVLQSTPIITKKSLHEKQGQLLGTNQDPSNFKECLIYFTFG